MKALKHTRYKKLATPKTTFGAKNPLGDIWTRVFTDIEWINSNQKKRSSEINTDSNMLCYIEYSTGMLPWRKQKGSLKNTSKTSKA